jgi:hypothetical protein
LLAGIVPAQLTGGPKDDELDDGSVGVGGAGGIGTNGGGGWGGVSGYGGGASPRRGGRPRLYGSPVLQVHDGKPYLVATVKVPAADITRVLLADVEVVVEGGGRESEPPLGAAMPQIMQWQSATGAIERGRTVRIPAGQESDWYVYATHVPDAVVRFWVSQVTSDDE